MDRTSSGAQERMLELDNVVLRDSRIHGLGGFARREIGCGTRVIEYRGEKITKAESRLRCESSNDCIFGLDEEFDLDGNVPSNPARYLNHSCAPNCESILEAGKIWIVALRDISAGEELTFDYGYDLEDYRQHPCHCGASGCAGFIIAAELLPQMRMEPGIAKVCTSTKWGRTVP